MKNVFCWGTFDNLHQGHIEFLKYAKSKGDSLTVLVVHDNAVYENKGQYPINPQQQRVEALNQTRIVDAAVPVSDDLEANLEMLASLDPDVFVFGHDQQTQMEERLKQYMAEHGLTLEYHTSKEFAGGRHAKDIS